MEWFEYPRLNTIEKRDLKLALKEFDNGKPLSFVVKAMMVHFPKDVAKIVAATETTKVYAMRNFIEGKKLEKGLKETLPDVIMYKTWETTDDDYRCDFCKENHGRRIGIDEEFSNGILIPPAHPGCRCGINFTTSLFD